MLAVAETLKRHNSALHIVYAIGKGDALIDIPKNNQAIDELVTVRAGKFRRYHGEGLLQMLDIKTLLKNTRDFFYVIAGFIQSYRMLGRVKPKVIFIKGGFVGVPVGLAAALRGIPYITHDSDAVPGLANRIIARWAMQHAVALPIEHYPYPPAKTVTVGVPIADAYITPVTKKSLSAWRSTLGLADASPVICVTGGGNGSTLINGAVIQIAQSLIARYKKIHILHIVGRGHGNAVNEAYVQALGGASEQVTVKEFVSDLYRYTGVADLVIARAGANTIADLGAQRKAAIIIPNPKLTGGHQTKNAHILSEEHAIEAISESKVREDPDLLLKVVSGLLDRPEARQDLADRLHTATILNATDRITELLVAVVDKRAATP